MKLFRTQYILLALLIAPFTGWSYNIEENENITEAGDILQWLLPITAGTATLLEEDWEGSKQFALSFGSAALANSVAKGAIGKLRPNESNTYSYPSGHTMAAFSGAGFLSIRYGPYVGVPALGLASFVGYSRIQSDHHYADDVLAGASVGLMFNWVWVTPYEGSYKLLPVMIDNETPGIAFSMPIDGTMKPIGTSGPEIENEAKPQDFRFGYTWDFGPVYNSHNKISDTSSGSEIDLTQFDDFSDNTMASRLFLSWRVNPKHIVAYEWAPYETRNKEAVPASLTYGGVTFTGDVRYAYRNYEHRFKYAYNFFDEDSGWLRIGGSVSYIYNALELLDESDNYYKDSSHTFLPQIYAGGGWRFHPKFALFADGSLGAISETSAIDVTAGAMWQINPQWVFAGGYRYYDREVEDGSFKNELTQHQPFLSFAYAW